MKTLYKLLAIGMVLGLAFTALPMGQASEVMAQDSGQTLNVAKWSGPTTLANVSGRQATIKVSDTYHMWYATSDTALFHTTSSTPTGFATGTQVTFTGGTPVEVGSVTVLYEGNTYYMIAYETSTGGGNQKFTIYSSGDGNAWTYKGTVFDGAAAFTQLTGFVKIDAPYLFKDGDTYRLYFQVKSRPTGSTYDVYHIYTAESTNASLYSIADGNADADFALANNGAQS